MGHDVVDIRGTDVEGSSDEVLWIKAQREGRLFITTDKGFSKYRHERHHGLIIIRLKQPNRTIIHKRVLQAFRQFHESEWDGLLVIMQDAVQSVWRVQ